MSTTTIAGAIGAAVWLFWAVGAYNRLVRLRQDVVRRFVPIDTQMKERHTLLWRQTELLGHLLANAQPRLDAVRAASRQSDVAREHAQPRPLARGPVKSLWLAEAIVVETRSRVPAHRVGANDELPDVNARLMVVDNALGFARQEFNEAMLAYNRAVAEFPTLMLAVVVGFSAGEPL